MSRQTPTGENIVGILFAGAGLLFVALLVFLNRYSLFSNILPAPNTPVKVAPAPTAPIKAQIIPAKTLQHTLATIEKQQQDEQARAQAEKARLAAEKQAAQRAAAEKARLVAEKQAAQREKAFSLDRLAQQKLTADKNAARKAAQVASKAAEEKAAAQRDKVFSLDRLSNRHATQTDSKAVRAAVRKASQTANDKARSESSSGRKASETQTTQADKDRLAARAAAQARARQLAGDQALADELLDHANEMEDAQTLSDLDDYATGALRAKMRQFWRLPPNLPPDLTVDLLIRPDRDGRVVKIMVDRSSGVPIFDNSAIDAVLRAAPLPLPNNPKALDVLVNEGIIATFEQW